MKIHKPSKVPLKEKTERKKGRNTMSNKLKSRVANPFLQVILRSSEVVISNNNLKGKETECHVKATNTTHHVCIAGIII